MYKLTLEIAMGEHGGITTRHQKASWQKLTFQETKEVLQEEEESKRETIGFCVCTYEYMNAKCAYYTSVLELIKHNALKVL